MTLEEIYKKAHRKLDKEKTWEWYLIEKYKETGKDEDRDALIDFEFDKYKSKYVEIRDGYITGKISKEIFLNEFHDFLYDAIKIGYDLGICRTITEQEIQIFITAIQKAYKTVDTSGGEVTPEINKQLCIAQIPEVDLFKQFYYNVLIAEKDKK